MFPDVSGLFRTMLVLSVIGIIAIVLGVGLGLGWLIEHVRFQ